MLVDDFEREISGIRVSLTDRCNFDCVYCHNEGLGDTRGPMDPQDNEMGTDEVVRLLEVAAEFDVEKVKFTGGEPMLRQDLEAIVRRCPDDIDVSLTTNGTFLPDRADDLVDAGVERVNVSQDAIDPEAFAEVTQSGAYDRVMEGVEAAVAAGLTPLKLNMVVFEATAGYVPGMVDHVACNSGLRLQLIEYMPEIAGHPEWAIDIGRVHNWLEDHAAHVETREMHDRTRYWVQAGEVDADDIDTGYGDIDASRDGPKNGEDASAPINGRAGMIEIVDPVENEEFCANCHRVRVTHDGALKGCLNRPRVHPMDEMTKPEIRAAFHDVVEDRVPYYGEYMVEDEDGEWVVNDEYVGEPAVAGDPMVADDD